MGTVEAAGTEEFDTSMLTKAENPVELNVTTTFAGEDGNVKNFQEAIKAYEEATGNTINDMSGTSNEAFKARVSADFQTRSVRNIRNMRQIWMMDVWVHHRLTARTTLFL